MNWVQEIDQWNKQWADQRPGVAQAKVLRAWFVAAMEVALWELDSAYLWDLFRCGVAAIDAGRYSWEVFEILLEGAVRRGKVEEWELEYLEAKVGVRPRVPAC